MSEHYQAKTEIQKSTAAQFSSAGKDYRFYSLPKLAQKLGIDLETLPQSLRIVLESVLRNADGTAITDNEIKALSAWNAAKPAEEEIPFTVARIVLQDFTGVPLLVDLAAMRNAMKKLGKNVKAIEPLVPVDLVVDHSVQVDFAGDVDSYTKNLKIEFERNKERYEFLKWGQGAFETFKVVPPGVGIIHQVNLEYLARGVLKSGDMVYPDTLVGTDSHTTMINGLGVVGWGVGGIEAEAGMLGQPIYFLTPEVVGMELSGKLREGVTATDLTLTITQVLRKEKVVGKFVEYFGEGAAALALADRATIANMAPEYGATMGFFGIDDETLRYLKDTGRSEENVKLVGDYYKAQGLFGIPKASTKIKYTKVIKLDLGSIQPSVAGPKRPQDRVVLSDFGASFTQLFDLAKSEGGFGKKKEDLKGQNLALKNASARGFAKLEGQSIRNGSVLIAAITSCTNTSNPSVMVAAGLVAKKANELGLKISPTVKTSLAPGSRVVTDYLEKAGLQTHLDKLGFNLVGYGCTTCIGNSGPLATPIEEAITEGDLVAASVLSGNRNFEARVHPAIKANYLMSPPLVVAFAIAGRVDFNPEKEPLTKDKNGKDVFLKDIWPTQKEVQDTLNASLKPEAFTRLYKGVDKQNPDWNNIQTATGDLYDWKGDSTYIQEPPFFSGFSLQPSAVTNIKNARALLLLGDSVTTDHISPAGSFKAATPAGKFLTGEGVKVEDFNSYGSRRGNDRIMTRGTFANVRIKNLMLGGEEGGYTLNLLSPGKEKVAVFDAAQEYKKAGVPLVVIGGKEYGTGSSRDWAAKGTQLLGVRAVITESFERIHRSNLVGMGVLPLCFEDGQTAGSLGLDGTEEFSILGIEAGLKPRQKLEVIAKKNGKEQKFNVVCRIDTPIEVEYYKHGGILPYVLRQIAAKA
ncbi:MAG TPA: aconitate hydratase AcnA [Bdellovibrionota bacterium]|nr:aconitate hydratase AcnA [Bdellovibrionota bacterium]